MTSAGTYVRKGFVDGAAAARGIEQLGDAGLPLTDELAASADPDAALDGLLRLADALDEQSQGAGRAMLAEVADDEGTAMRLCSVLGASTALAHHLARHPEQWRELTDPTLGTTRPAAYALREALLTAVGADPHADEPVAGLPDKEAVDALRVEYRRLLLRLAARDLAHHVGLDDAAAEISDLAAATLDARARRRPRPGRRAGAAVPPRGHRDGQVRRPRAQLRLRRRRGLRPRAGGVGAGDADDGVALRAATQLASHLMRICSDHTREGTIWPVDANLRPEGSQGPLVRTLASHRGYYERWAKTWEFQALLKARPVAGDLELGRRYVEMVAPMVWSAAERDGFVADVQAMRRRVVDHIPAHEAERQLKLGSGGLRDVEFAVQLLQLVHGRADASLRAAATLSALAAPHRRRLRRPRGRRDARTRPTRSCAPSSTGSSCTSCGVPTSCPTTRRPCAGSAGRWASSASRPPSSTRPVAAPPARGAPAAREALLPPAARRGRQAARRRGAAVARGGGRPGSPRWATPTREAALRHLEALTSGVSRTSDIQRTLLPVLLEWFADSPDPDAGLFGFRRISESAGPQPVVPRRCCATRARSPQRLARRARPPRATRPTSSSASRRA